MRAVVQRVREATVTVAGQPRGRIGTGLLVLVGAAAGDTEADVEYVARKVAGLRVFDDEAGRMNRSLAETAGAVLVISQFTLHGDCRQGRRPSFTEAMAPDGARPLLERLCQRLREHGLPVETGEFGAAMDVALVNHGPVTLLLDSRRLF